MTVLDRKLRRDFAGARTTLLAILLVIVVGVASFVGMASVYVNLEQARRDYYARCRMADFWVSLKKAPLAEVDRLRNLPGVAEVRPRIVFEATVDLEGVARPLTGQVISLAASSHAVINDIVIARGGTFTGERLEEVIVNDSFARARGVRPGDVIHLILNNRRQDLFVVGTAISSEFVYLMSPGSLVPDPDNYGVFYVKQQFAEETLDFHGACNQVVGLLTPGARANPAPVLDAIERRLEPFGVFTSTPRSEQSSHQILEGELAELRSSAVVLPAIFLAVAVLVLNILMGRLAEQQRTTVGTLKALGYSNRMLMRHYLSFGVAIGVAGGLLGLVAGYGIAQSTIVLYRVWFEIPRLDNRIVPEVYAAAVALSIAFSLLGTVRGVRSILRLDAAEAMRAKPPVAAGGVFLERFGAVWRRLGFRWRMVARSVWRHRWRAAASVFAAAMGSAMVFTTVYLTDSMYTMLDFEFEKVLKSDYDLVFGDELDEGAVLETRRLPGVEHVEPLLMVACEYRSGHHTKRSGIIGVTSGARLTAARTTGGGRVPIPDAGLLMSSRLAGLLDVRPGDRVTVVPVKGLREPRRVVVAGVVDGFLGMATYADYDWLNRLVGETGAVSVTRLATRRDDVEQRLAFYRALKELPVVQSVADTARAKEKLVTMLLDVLWWALGVLVVMAGAIFFGSILTTSLISISERRREVATFLVMGYGLRDVSGIFLRESLLVNLLGAGLGLPLGWWLAILLIEANDRDAYRFPTVASPLSYVITLALAVVFTLLAHGLVHRAIRRLDWLAALNAQE